MSARPYVSHVATARLEGRRPALHDGAFLDRMYQDGRVNATLGGPRTDVQTREILLRWMVHWDEHGYGPWVFSLKGEEEPVGWGGLQHTVVARSAGAERRVPPRREQAGAEEVEVLYAVVPEQWGQGFAAEMATASVRVAFDDLGLDDLVCFTLTTNAASRRVMEKAGFRAPEEIEHAGRPHVMLRRKAHDPEVPDGIPDTPPL